MYSLHYLRLLKEVAEDEFSSPEYPGQVEKQRRLTEKKMERQKGGRKGGKRGQQPEPRINRSRSTKKGGFLDKPGAMQANGSKGARRKSKPSRGRQQR